MSFTFNWPRFSDQFHFDAIQMLNNALNKGNKPPVIADRIEVVELEMGTQPPELEIRDIGELTVDQFRGIFRLTYSGDAHLVLKTKVQANPLNHKQPDIHLMAGSRGMLAAKQPLVVPMLLRLSHFKLNSYVVLVVSKQKGITLVFKTDPLQNVDINSTFDSIAVIQKFIQREIEGQLRQMFREDLPGIIHRLSQQWVKAKVEAPYLQKRPLSPPVTRRQHTFETHSSSDISFNTMPTSPYINGGRPIFLRRPNSIAGPKSHSYPKRPRSVSGFSSASAPKPKSPKSSPPTPLSPDPVTFPDLENYDPTYGLRPEGLPTKSVFRGFGSLFTPNRGLADLAEDTEEDEHSEHDDEDGAASFDIVNWDYTVPDSSTSIDDDALESIIPESEYETIPAVGGGTITRPRIYHSQSMIQPTFESLAQSNSMASSSKQKPALQSYGSFIPPRSGFTTPGLVSRHPTGIYNPFSSDPPGYGRSRSAHSVIGSFFPPPPFSSTSRLTPDSTETQPSRSSSGQDLSTSTPPTEQAIHNYNDYTNDIMNDFTMHLRHNTTTTAPSSRRPSISAGSTLDHTFSTGSPPAPLTLPMYLSSSHAPTSPSHGNPKIIMNNSIHHLATLSHSNHTLSPYTRALEHFTVRSVPPRSAGGPFHSAGERQPTKARRKRIFRLGGAKTQTTADIGDAGIVDGNVNKGLKNRPKLMRDGISRPEFDTSDMDRYFRAHDESEPVLDLDLDPLLHNPITQHGDGAGQPGQSPSLQDQHRQQYQQELHLHHLYQSKLTAPFATPA